MSGIPTKLTQAQQILDREGPVNLARKGLIFGYETTIRALHSATGHVNRGQNVYDRDWDVLIILDACRVDLIESVSAEYDFINSTDTHVSPSSYSLGWMQKTFTEEYADEMANTAMVSGNPYTAEALDANDFLVLDEVWKYAFDDDSGSIWPRPLTDRAIATAREHNPDRLIIHYMQPHIPFLQNPELAFMQADIDSWGTGTTDSIWAHVRSGRISFEEMWAAYEDNLRLVLDDVELLLENLDAETAVLSADHGNAVGEYGLYGHPRKIAIDALRVVPWIETQGVDSGSHTPEDHQTDSSQNLQEKLRDLGYA